MEGKNSHRYRFDGFELDVSRFELTKGGKLVAIEPQVFGFLVYLIEHRDRVVSKDELFDELWGHRFVSEAALTTQLKALRRTLGDSGAEQRFIRTVRGKGYRFVAVVDEDQQTRQPSVTSRVGNLGVERTPLYGRERDIDRCITALQENRMVTLLGIGGTGKTALAKAVGRQLQSRYVDGVWFIDLVPVSSAAGIDYAVANALGLRLGSGEIRQQLAGNLRDRSALIIFDNCEHIEDEVAAAMDSLLEFTRAPRFLLTSRDPLNLAGEYDVYLKPLAVDGEAETSPAVQLFNATAKLHGAAIQRTDLSEVSSICRQLDGLPLAIELAAAQLRHLSLDELSNRLARRFEVLSGRRRIGNRRQTNLHKVLKDTWALLTATERRLLSQLAVFPSTFTMTDAESLLETSANPETAAAAISRFVELSLISRTAATGAWWRLLESVRIFAMSQTEEAEQFADAQRHAAWCLEQVGDNPLRHRHDFTLARWVIAHYDDIIAAQDYLFASGRCDDLAMLTSGLALTMQLDEGVRAREQLDRVQRYLQATEKPLSLSRLHAVAGVCGIVLGQPDLLAEHAEAGLSAIRNQGEPGETASQLILVSVRTSFTDPPRATAHLDEAVVLAETANEPELVDAANTFRAWHLTIEGDYAAARAYAREIAERNIDARFNNLTFNAVSALIACCAFEEPAEALAWTERLMEKEDAHLSWAAQLLFASIFAMHGQTEICVELIRRVRKRLNQAGWDGLPDLLVPCVLAYHSGGDNATAAKLVSAIRSIGTPLQSFHLVSLYQQFRGVIPAATGVKTSRRQALAALDELTNQISARDTASTGW